jgi:sulfur-oxidizing protein SoxX
MKNLKALFAISAITATAVVMQGSVFAQQANDPKFNKMMKDGFRAEGIAGLDRIAQNETQKFCSDPVFANSKQGEAIAQSGRGATWTNTASTPIGGGCYNCHQIDKKEISYGTIGPSLWNYGKMRGYSPEVVTYTWNRINNSKAYNACSNMPRFAHFKLLNEQQIQDVMALLLDLASPVNQ